MSVAFLEDILLSISSSMAFVGPKDIHIKWSEKCVVCAGEVGIWGEWCGWDLCIGDPRLSDQSHHRCYHQQ